MNQAMIGLQVAEPYRFDGARDAVQALGCARIQRAPRKDIAAIRREIFDRLRQVRDADADFVQASDTGGHTPLSRRLNPAEFIAKVRQAPAKE